MDHTKPTASTSRTLAAFAGYLVLGTLFGLTLAKSEAISWFRIQEMFRFDSFHMYGILGSGVVVAAASLWLLRRLGVRSFTGEEIAPSPKDKTPGLVRYWAGGGLFGLGWGILGACPGPIYVLVAHGETVFLVSLVAALAGTLVYGLLRPRLPH